MTRALDASQAGTSAASEPSKVQQPDTLAEGLEVTGWFRFDDAWETWEEVVEEAKDSDGVVALTPHAEATRQLADLRAQVFAEREAGNAENRMRLAAEAEAAGLREAIDGFALEFIMLHDDSSEFSDLRGEPHRQAVRDLCAALAQTKRRP